MFHGHDSAKEFRPGEEAGEVCNRAGCTGIMELEDRGGCSCHLGMAPCSQCCQNPVCNECGFGEDKQP